MLQVARLAPQLLGEASSRVQAFFEDQFVATGGAVDRVGDVDLYYTVFALDGLVALRAELPEAATRSYLQSLGGGDELDLVHVACLARCWRAIGGGGAADAIAGRLAGYRSADGGSNAEPGSERGTVYHAFLTLGAYQDLELECPDLASLAGSVGELRTADGGYANLPGLPVGSTTVTAAAATLLRYLGCEVPPGVAEWLLARAHPEGGFRAAPEAPLPDLLSTATALHALSGLGVSLSRVREACLDFLDTLWTGRAFCGHWADDAQDSEYTFYALLALGHLSVE